MKFNLKHFYKSCVLLAGFVLSIQVQADDLKEIRVTAYGKAGACPENSICDSAGIEALFETLTMARQEYSYGGGGDNPVKEIIEKAEESKEEEECRRNTLTPEEIAADQAGHEFPVLRPFRMFAELPSNWVQATSKDKEDYIAAVGQLPHHARSTKFAAMKDPANDAKMPGECGE